MRLTIEAIQVWASLHTLQSDIVFGFFWFVKSVTSLMSDSLSFISDLLPLNSLLKNELETFFPSSWLTKYKDGVKGCLYKLRSNMVIGSMIVTGLYFAFKLPTLSEDKKVWTTLFLGVYFFESFLKFNLYDSKSKIGGKPLLPEFYTYVFATLFEIGETGATVFGLI